MTVPLEVISMKITPEMVQHEVERSHHAIQVAQERQIYAAQASLRAERTCKKKGREQLTKTQINLLKFHETVFLYTHFFQNTHILLH
jgi:hypothetical protein